MTEIIYLTFQGNTLDTRRGKSFYQTLILNTDYSSAPLFTATMPSFKALLALQSLKGATISHINYNDELNLVIHSIELECKDGTIEFLYMLNTLPKHEYVRLLGLPFDELKRHVKAIYLARELTK